MRDGVFIGHWSPGGRQGSGVWLPNRHLGKAQHSFNDFNAIPVNTGDFRVAEVTRVHEWEVCEVEKVLDNAGT